MIDAMVLGNALKEHGVKAAKILCINDDTREHAMANLMRAFWEFREVWHVELPSHLEGSEQTRLRGVYSKLQTMNLFATGTSKKLRFLLMDADMLPRSNLDDVFSSNVPAGVMRGDADSCLFRPRPSESYFHRDVPKRRKDSHRPMRGGINAGLILFEPKRETWQDMKRALDRFRPQTKMAEQEFLSYYWGEKGELHALHKKNNFQIHQLYFTLPKAEMNQTTPNSFEYMVQHPDEVRVFHFSADRKPSNILVDDMKPVEGWLKMDEHLAEHAAYMMGNHGSRNADLHNHPRWITKIEHVHKVAHLEWFDAWKRTYENLVRYVLETAYETMRCGRDDSGDYIQCPCCEAHWDIKLIEDESQGIRDHLLFNCIPLAKEINIPSLHQTNLLTQFFVPCGSQVESKLLYWAEVHRIWMKRGKPSYRTTLPSLHLCPDAGPQLTLPLYAIPRTILAVTEDRGVSAANVTSDEPELAMRTMMRRYERAMNTLRKSGDILCWKKDFANAGTWEQTLASAHEAGKWLMQHGENIEVHTRSKATAGHSASSSDPLGPAAGIPEQAAATAELHPTPPWREVPMMRPTSKAMPGQKRSPSVPPPPPPPRRRRNDDTNL